MWRDVAYEAFGPKKRTVRRLGMNLDVEAAGVMIWELGKQSAIRRFMESKPPSKTDFRLQIHLMEIKFWLDEPVGLGDILDWITGFSGVIPDETGLMGKKKRRTGCSWCFCVEELELKNQKLQHCIMLQILTMFITSFRSKRPFKVQVYHMNDPTRFKLPSINIHASITPLFLRLIASQP